MRKRLLAIALAVLAAILLVAVRWRSIAPPPPVELPSSRPEAPHRPSAASVALAYTPGEDDDEPPNWQVAGVVIDERGVPVPGATLEADLVCLHGVEHPAPTRTDGEGKFALELLPDCAMWLYVSRDGEAARVIVSRLPGAPVTIEVVRDNDVIVHVMDSVSHAPIANARAIDQSCRRAVCPDALSDGTGTIHLARAYSLRILAAGYAANGIYLDDTWRPLDDGPVALERTVALTPIRHVVGELLDADGAPIGGGDAEGWYAGSAGYAPVHATTGDDGRFEIDLPVGTSVYARKDCAHKALIAEGRPEDGRPFVLHTKLAGPCEPVQRPWRPDPPNLVSYGPPRPPPHEPPELDVSVVVLDQAGRPVPKAEVRSFSNSLRPGRTNAEGRYSFRTHGIADLYARRGERMSPLGAVSRDNRELTLRIQPAAITGIVVDNEGRPVARAWVRARLPRGMSSATIDELTDAEGHFGFVLPPGQYLVSAYDMALGIDADAPNATVISTNTRDVTFEIP